MVEEYEKIDGVNVIILVCQGGGSGCVEWRNYYTNFGIENYGRKKNHLNACIISMETKI